MPLFRRKPQVHRADVVHVVNPGDPPYYVAVCECGWYSDFYAESTGPHAAFAEARQHTSDVGAEVLERP